MAKGKKDKINYNDMTIDELNGSLLSSKEELFHLRLKNASAPLKNPKEISKMRKNIARINTAINLKGKEI